MRSTSKRFFKLRSLSIDVSPTRWTDLAVRVAVLSVCALLWTGITATWAGLAFGSILFWAKEGVRFNSRLFKPSGNLLLSMAEFLYSSKTYQRVFLPIISDMREEYFEALSQNRIWKARWVRVRGTWSFFAAMGLDRAFVFVSFFVKAWKSVN